MSEIFKKPYYPQGSDNINMMHNSTADIRQKFLDFFKSKGHQVVSSSSLIPHHDPTLLFTNAGMNPFKNIFLGIQDPDFSRATSSQRCVRAGGKHNDLENVGYTARHHTFFEMLGNFSFGDYFKQQAIYFAWELLTGSEWFHLPKDRLYVTVYSTDDEAYNIWADEIGIPRERIIRIGDNKGAAFCSDNFWQMGETGPCGPCSEIFYDHGDHLWGGLPGSPEEEGDRYIEIWNIVFMQFNRLADGTMLPLPKPSVDTGMGLERMAAVLQNVSSNYEIDLFRDLISGVKKVTGATDDSNPSLRVIADHIRACAFLIFDGVRPSNEGRGYVLRRIIRRAIRHGNKLGVKKPFFYQLLTSLIGVMKPITDQLKHHQVMIEQVLKTEEELFSHTLERGLSLLDKKLDHLKGDTLEGETAFLLYDTYGFPLDLTADVCRERNLKIDEVTFHQKMSEQRARARQASAFSTDYNKFIRVAHHTEFCGYEQLQQTTVIKALFFRGEEINEIHAGQEALVILDKTPFYAESGGQVGDKGYLKSTTAHFMVSDTQKYGQAIVHLGQPSKGSLRISDHIQACVNNKVRDHIRSNHSATHLLHAALRQVLGKHVVQKGSLVNEKCCRFDFSHFKMMTPDEIENVESLVNQQIRQNHLIETQIMSLEDAKKKGATALFGEKYEDQVRVLSMGDFSIELCGGTHARRTGDIGLFHITSESSTAAGIRRIEAITGEEANALLCQQRNVLQDLARLLKSDEKGLIERIGIIIDRNKVLEKKLQHFKDQEILQKTSLLLKNVKQIKEIKILIAQLDAVEPILLRRMIDDLKNQLGSAVILLANVTKNKISFIAGVTKNLTQQIKADDLIHYIAPKIGGKGGGRADMAQAGGTNINSLATVLAEAEKWIVSHS